MTLTFDLDMTLTMSLTFDLDNFKNTKFNKICDFFEVTWRKKSDIILQTETARSLYDFRFKSYGSNDDFDGF